METFDPASIAEIANRRYMDQEEPEYGSSLHDSVAMISQEAGV
jgi:hypothetical protein